MSRQYDYNMISWRPALKNGTSVELHLEVDQSALLDRLGDKALKSKRGYSRIASGAVRVRVVKRI